MNKENNDLINNDFVKREKLLIQIINDYLLEDNPNKFLREIINSPDNFKTGSLKNDKIYSNYRNNFNVYKKEFSPEGNTIYVNGRYVTLRGNHHNQIEPDYLKDVNFQNCAFLMCFLNQTAFMNCNFNFTIFMTKTMYDATWYPQTITSQTITRGLIRVFENSLHNCIFTNTQMINTQMYGIGMYNSRFRNVDLTGANLRYADLSDCDFKNVNLTGANLMYANLSKSNFIKTNLTGANLMYADLSETFFCSSNLTNANISYSINVTDETFKNANTENIINNIKTLKNTTFDKISNPKEIETMYNIKKDKEYGGKTKRKPNNQKKTKKHKKNKKTKKCKTKKNKKTQKK